MPAGPIGAPGVPTLPTQPNGKMWEVLTDMAFQSAVCGESQQPLGIGVYGINDQDGVGVNGQSHAGTGVRGTSEANGASGFLAGKDPIFKQHAGVFGSSDQQGVIGMAGGGGTGVFGGNTSGGGFGVRGETTHGTAVQGQSFGDGLAGKFIGNVLVTGTLTANIDVCLGADCAEEFNVVDGQHLEPGTVVVIDQEGAVRESCDAYDKKVAGIVSGAGGYRPGIVLDRRTADPSRTVIALVGKVYCKVDAEYGPIDMGDLLTPSPTPGHAMKASDPGRAFGAVIGKALRPLQDGRGLVPVLVALQ